MGRTVTDLWAPPAVFDMWGHTYNSSAIFTGNGYYPVTLSYETQSEMASTFDVEVKYWKDGEWVTEVHVLPGSGEITVDVGGAGENLSNVQTRVRSSLFGQHIQMYANDLNFTPGSGGENGTPVSDGIADAGGIFGSHRFSPLVFDLNGQYGLQLDPLEGSSVFYDLDNDGFAEQAGWTRTEGFLVRDANGNGLIDNQSEMFGLTAGGSTWSSASTACAPSTT